MPIITPATMRQAAIRANSRMLPPSRMASVLVSPIEPGMKPRNASVQLRPFCARAPTPLVAAWLSAVAPA